MNKLVEFGAILITSLIIFMLAAMVKTFIVLLCWNLTFAPAVGLEAISFWQAFGISFLASLLFEQSIKINPKDK